MKKAVFGPWSMATFIETMPLFGYPSYEETGTKEIFIQFSPTPLNKIFTSLFLACYSRREGYFCVVEGGEKGFKFFLTEYFFKPMCCA